MKIIYCMTAVGWDAWEAIMLGVPIFFLETWIWYMGHIQLEGGIGNSTCCLPDNSIWMMTGDFRLAGCAEHVCWPFSPSVSPSVGDLRGHKGYHWLQNCSRHKPQVIPDCSFLPYHIIKFCQLHLKMSLESWIFPLCSVFTTVYTLVQATILFSPQIVVLNF